MFKKKSPLFPNAQYPLLFGHRGCSLVAPENTMSAFQLILDNEVPGVELDVHQCKSGELVVTHDSNLKRVTGFDGEIEEMEYAQIRELEAGAWFNDSFSGEKIPLLNEVLDLMGDKVYYDIEIKQYDHKYTQLEQSLSELIRSRRMQEQIMVSSFNPFSLRHIRQLAPEIKTAYIYSSFEDMPWLLRSGAGCFISRPMALKPNRFKINPKSLFFRQKIEGYPVITWTEDNREIVDKFLSMGVDGVISNVPEQLVTLFKLYWQG